MVMEVETISLGDGKDTVVFASSAAANGEDTITGFTAGSGNDVLDFTATGVKKGTPVIAGSGTLSSGSGIAVITGVESIEEINFASSVSSAGDVKLSNAGNYIIITDVDDDNKAGNIYFVTAASSSDTNPDFTLIGTVMREGDATAYVAENLLGA